MHYSIASYAHARTLAMEATAGILLAVEATAGSIFHLFFF
jgi:hypothetical protein